MKDEPSLEDLDTVIEHSFRMANEATTQEERDKWKLVYNNCTAEIMKKF